jgi:hypothetical protein
MGKTNEIAAWSLMDEPGSMSLEHIAACTNNACQPKFRTYLQGLGLTPAFFGYGAWNEIDPTTNKSAAALFYYTSMFRGRIATDFYKTGNAFIAQTIANMPTTMNFAEALTFTGFLLGEGIDWFDVFEQGALHIGWCEDWLPYTATKQLGGYRADFLRAATAPVGGQFGMYNILTQPWDTGAKSITDIGHGARQIYYYDWGPNYILAGDAQSANTNLYAGLKRINHLIGGAEDYLAGASSPTSKLALLYSHATDVWTMDRGYSEFGKDRMGLYLILRHLGYPVDILTDKDVVNGKLAAGGYRMLICDGSHCDSNAVPPLVAWLQAGGTLYLGAGALTRDQFDNPLGFDAQAGIARAAYQFVQNPGREQYEFPGLPNLKPVTYGTNTLEALCGYQKATNAGSGATVLATFNDDGSPAVFTKAVGHGILEFCGFFPGLAYQKQAMIAKQARDAVYTNCPIYSATDWPAAYRTLFASLVGSLWTPPVAASHYLVEANRLEGSNGSAMALANWTGMTVTNLQVAFPRKGRQGRPFTISNAVKSIAEAGGAVTVTLDLAGPGDFILLPAGAHGFQGQYFNGTNSAAPVLTRNDDTTAFDWGSGAPDALVASNGFTARWTGRLTPLYSETYTFHLTADDGVRLWINGRMLIDDWSAGPVRTRSATIGLTSGQAVSIQLEYTDWSGGASVMLEWESASQARGLVPSSALAPAAGVLWSDNFERYPRGPLPPTNGWISSSAAVAVSNAAGQSWFGGNPFPMHSNVLWVAADERAANAWADDGPARVWADFYMRPTLNQKPLDELHADTNQAIVVLFDEEGRAIVRDGCGPGAWRVLTNTVMGAPVPPVTGSNLIRVAIFADYGYRTYALFINGLLLAEGLHFAADRPAYTGLTFTNGALVDNILVNADTYPDGTIPGASPALIGDLDGDGWPDAWEIQMFGTIGNYPLENVEITIVDFRVSGTTTWLVARANLSTADLHPRPWYADSFDGLAVQWHPVTNAAYTRSGGVYTQWFGTMTNGLQRFFKIGATNSS